MYKYLLCWRYLRTRYLAMVCIVSVMLGVATLILVNSVMSGFSTKLKQRLHGLLSDVLVESYYNEGFADPEEKMERIRNSPIGDKIEAMTPSIEVLGLVEITYHGEKIPRAVRLIGIEPQARAELGGFSEFLLDPQKRENPDFELSPEARAWHDSRYPAVPSLPLPLALGPPGGPPPPVPPAEEEKIPTGVIVGYSIANYRSSTATASNPNKDIPVLQVGDELTIVTLSGQKLAAVYDRVVVADEFKSEMSECDSNYVYVPLDWLQRLRTMENRANNILIKLKKYDDHQAVVDELKQMFPGEAGYQVQTWEDKQGPLLAAISIERGILNVLLFLIIGVAGFGILAIFAMIVVEKTRDIGILKSLGASNSGVMRIFLGYGLLLGIVGAALGTGLGLTITTYLNQIEQLITRSTGQEIFNRRIYYFDQIPTDVGFWSVVLVNLGAVGIAVLFSVLPALRAAMLHPVKALRYE
ncbi:MAG TPA: ABC transporter permease [Gemmataceae bacterium]|nr:ABC transporter permease [Gemmataceae bacterium]